MRAWIWLLTLGLAALPVAAQTADGAANKSGAIGDDEPAPSGPQPARTPAADNGASPPALPPPPADAGTARPPEPIAPAAPGPSRKKAYIYVLDPNSVVRTKGPDNSVVARGRLQMVIPDDEVIVFCNAVDYTGEKTGIATVTGDLKIVTGTLSKKNGVDVIASPENVVTGVMGYVFTKEKRAVIDDQVVVVHNPQEPAPADADDLEQAKHDPTTLFCDRLTYWYRKGDRKAVAQARLPNTRIRFEQKSRRGTAGQATFYDFEEGESETGDVVDLVGGVYGEDDDGQLIEAEVCRLFTDTDSSQWYNVKRVIVNLEEEEAGTPAAAPAPPGGGAPATVTEPGALPASPAGAAAPLPAAPATAAQPPEEEPPGEDPLTGKPEPDAATKP